MANERLISAPKLVIELAKRYNRSASNNGLICYDAVMASIADAPTVETVEVVRCKDCRFYEEAESSLIGKVMCCTGQGDVRIQKQANDFCSYGERREGE